MYGIVTKNDKYIVEDSTQSGFISRTSKITYDWRTVWDKDLNLVAIEMDFIPDFSYKSNENYQDMMSVLTNKKHEDYHQVVRAKGRHLKMLKEHLGLIKPKEESIGTKFIIYTKYYYSGGNYDIGVKEVVETEKMLGDMRKNKIIDYIKATPEKEKLLAEYNKKRKEAEDILDHIFEK